MDQTSHIKYARNRALYSIPKPRFTNKNFFETKNPQKKQHKTLYIIPEITLIKDKRARFLAIIRTIFRYCYANMTTYFL